MTWQRRAIRSFQCSRIVNHFKAVNWLDWASWLNSMYRPGWARESWPMLKLEAMSSPSRLSHWNEVWFNFVNDFHQVSWSHLAIIIIFFFSKKKGEKFRLACTWNRYLTCRHRGHRGIAPCPSVTQSDVARPYNKVKNMIDLASASNFFLSMGNVLSPTAASTWLGTYMNHSNPQWIITRGYSHKSKSTQCPCN